MATINIGDAEIYFEEHGSGEPLFFVAGLGGRAQFWNNQVKPFSEFFRVIVYDHRGVGRSSPKQLAAGTAQMADDLLKIMNAMDIPKAHLVGHSTGGAIGQHISLNAPERLGKLVLSSTWPGPDPFLTELFKNRKRVLLECGPETYLKVGTFLAAPGTYLQTEMASAQNYLDDRINAFPGLSIELSRINAVMDHDLRDQVHKITHRPLCICAEDDQITPPNFTKELADQIPGSKLALLSKGGHFCPIVSAAEYNVTVLPFLLN